MSNIVTLWVKHQREQHGLNQTQALDHLNSDLSMCHAPHRLTEWKNEKRTLPVQVANYMLEDAVTYVQRHKMSFMLLRLPVPPK